jgi:hypothetical protein
MTLATDPPVRESFRFKLRKMPVRLAAAVNAYAAAQGLSYDRGAVRLVTIGLDCAEDPPAAIDRRGGWVPGGFSFQMPTTVMDEVREWSHARDVSAAEGVLQLLAKGLART